MTGRARLWIGFAIVHVVVAWLGFFEPNQPMGDVYFVYEPWAIQAWEGRGIPGVDFPWIYPHLALVPMLFANGIEWIAGYEVAWAILVTAADAVAFALLVGAGRSRPRRTAAWFWLAFALLLGPVGMYRLDAITVPLGIVGCVWLIGRPWAASVLLAVATWIKVWPAALLLAALIAVRRRGAIVGGALVVSALTLVAVVVAGGAGNAFGFVSGQTGRGLQIEAPVSGWYLWRAVFGDAESWLYYDTEILTFQVTGPNVDLVIAAMTPILFVTMAGIAALGAVKAVRGARFVRLFPPVSLALVLAFIVMNKVGSPQYLTWLIPPLVFALVVDRRRAWGQVIAGLVAAALTHLVYPLTYGGLLVLDPVAVGILTVRNVVLVGMLVWAVAQIARVPAGSRHPSLAPPAR
jgi:hypothetical protein